VFNTRLQFSLAFVREDGDWKLIREGSPGDELAAAVIDTPDPVRRRELLAAEKEIVNSRLVDAIGRRADALAQRQDYKAAQTVYERALEVALAIGDRKAEGQMLQNIANGYYFLRNFPAALTTYEKRLVLEREMKNEDGIASALVGVATIRYSMHEYTPALALYLEALAIQERQNDEGLVATTLVSTGNVRFIQGDFEGAIADYRRAEVLKRKYHDYGGAAMALEGLGRSYAGQGDYAAALLAFTDLLGEARQRRDVRRQASALQHLGDTHFRLANTDAARGAYDESRQQYEKAADLANAGRVWQGTAVTELLSGRFAPAEAAYGRSITACNAAVPEPDAECAARALVGLAFAQSAQERYDDAIASYRKGIAAFETLKSTENAARARVGLAEALSGKEQFVPAIETAIEARRSAIALDADDVLWRALIAQARAQRRLGKKAESLGAARAAVSAVERMAAAALRRPGDAAPRDTAAAFATTVLLHAELGDAAAAWNAAEAMRAHALRAVLAPNERNITRGMTEDEKATERKVATDLRPLLAQHEREKTLPKPDSARLARLASAIKDAIARREASLQQLFARLPELRIWRGLAPPATVDDLKTILENGALVVQFVLDERDVVVLTAELSTEGVITGAHVVPLRRQELAERVARAIDSVSLGSLENWWHRAGEVSKVIPERVLTQMTEARRILVIPDDVLWRVPFEALPVSPGYLGNRATVMYATSVTSLVRAPATPARPATVKASIAAAPEIPQAIVETLKTTAPTWGLRAAEPAEKEAARVRAVFGEADATVLTGPTATKEAVRTAAAGASVLHVAAPFRVNAASPLFSPILLAAGSATDAAPTAGNPVLEVRELPAAELATRLLVFSDPAALSMREVAGVLSAFQWTLRAAGIDAVMIRRWGSDEQAASDLLGAFYERLRDGATPVDALSAARASARKSDAPPQVWAGWMLIGGRN
jgi:tetratricopeptide (TPR) repeat protein